MATHAPKAVFLSYASQDVEAARRIADALRGFGIEVWFDQHKLRGGDAWDQKIRKQIRECTLFMPVISATTQDRGEGYFRREWHLAVERSHDMAEGVPFLVPVVVDDFPQASAIVPPQFQRVQWTRLAHGLPSPQFVEQVQRLVALPHQPVGGPSTEVEGPIAAPAVPARRRVPTWAWMAMAAIIVGAVTAVVVSQQSTSPKLAAESKATATPVLSDKSIAVLHFKNLSEEKGSAYFADGMHDSILTCLAQVGELRVVSSTSVDQYRDSKKPLRQIAQELGVAYMLEGSVQRAGSRVRVTGQLIRSATDEHVWARSYDRDLTDVFAIQSELAQEIATSLHAALSPQEKKLLERKPTENLAAYNRYVQAREILRKASSDRKQAETLLQEAVQLDPYFVLAWGDLCFVHATAYSDYSDHTDARIAKCREAMERIIVLAPDWPGRLRAVGDYYYFCLRDSQRAKEHWQSLVNLQPNNCEALGGLGIVAQAQGRWIDQLAYFRTVQRLDPVYFQIVDQIPVLLEAGRRYREAEEERRRSLNPQRNELTASFALALLSFRARGSTREVEEFLGKLTNAEADSNTGIGIRKRWAILIGNREEFGRLDKLKPNLAAAAPVRSLSSGLLVPAVVLAANGDLAGARARVENVPAELRQRLAGEPANDLVWATLGMVEALLGHGAEALRCAQKVAELVPESSDALSLPRIGASRAFVYAWTGDKDRAIAEYARLLRVPYSGLNIYEMKHNPWYAPLRGDPRWEALLNDPQNNAPLF